MDQSTTSLPAHTSPPHTTPLDNASLPSHGGSDNPILLLDSDSDSGAIPDKQPRQYERNLQKMAEKAVIEHLREAVSGYQSRANYCLGGSIPTSPLIETYCSSVSQPIVIRYDTAPSHTTKVEFPLPGSDASGLEGLLKTCNPATFGIGGKDVLDESYRKAGKLDKTDFSTNFHPCNFGIIDAIAQTLLPGIAQMSAEQPQEDVRNTEHLGVTAELYKLNVYSGPSGKFHKHVDTPRGATRFGSLVVCLPHPHQGGALKVSHVGHDTLFDWSNENSTDIKWAAFYSDCEHEILNVRSGHRITLTYNLYVSEHIGGVLRRRPTADPTLYPLFEGAKKMLEAPAFMIEGGTIGFFCAHQYAHTGTNTEQLMPYALKGIDATLFMVFHALGVNVTVRPILRSDEFADYHQNLWENASYHSEEDDLDKHEKELAALSMVGSKFHEMKLVDDRANYDFPDFLSGYWPYDEFRDIVWLNADTKKGWEVAMVNMKYGNESSLSWSYSHAAILIDIPPRVERENVPEEGSTLPEYK